MTEKTRCNSISTTTGRSTSCNKLSILYILKEKLLNIIETTLVKLRHVDVINEENFLRTKDLGSEQIFTLLFKITFKCILKVLASSLTREIDECWIKLFVRIHQEVFDNDRFTDTSLTAE